MAGQEGTATIRVTVTLVEAMIVEVAAAAVKSAAEAVAEPSAAVVMLAFVVAMNMNPGPARATTVASVSRAVRAAVVGLDERLPPLPGVPWARAMLIPNPEPVPPVSLALAVLVR